MTRNLRPAILTTLAGSAWLMAATLAQADAAPAKPASVPPSEQVTPDATPQLPIPAILPPGAGEAAGAGTAAGAANAEFPAIPPVDPGRWSFTVSPYLWMAGVKSSSTFTPTGSGRTLTANVDESFGDIFSDLNFAIMAGAEARRGLFSVQTDVMYIDVLQSDTSVRSVTGPLGRLEVPVDLGGKLRLKTTVWTLTGGYDIFRNDHGFVQLFGGFRYLGLRSTLDWNFQGPLGNLARAGSVKSNTDIWNGIAGLRGEHALGDGAWKAIYYVDVGAGGSKLTYQGLAQVAYVRRWGDIGLGWRYLDFQQGSEKATANLRMSGPVITFNWRFGG
jgi:hypothetical protein